jgi:hypothetical protein
LNTQAEIAPIFVSILSTAEAGIEKVYNKITIAKVCSKSTEACKLLKGLKILVAGGGIEPPTLGL